MNRPLRSLVASALVAVACISAPLMTSAPVHATGLPDFTEIIERVDPSVVNIRTTSQAPSRSSRAQPPGGPNPQDPFEMFRWFFGPDFMPPGQPDAQPRPNAPQQGQQPPRQVPRGVGSGFFVSNDGFILTNHHVVDGADEIIVTLLDRREFRATIVGSDERTDVALIKIEASNTPAVRIGDPNQLRKGEWVVAIGSPFGLESTVTAGIVSAKGRDTGDYLPFIQTDVAVNPGNSGGPLLNLRGEVVGINSQIISRSGGFMGISLAIPIDEAMLVSEQLRNNGRVIRGRIGVQIGDVSREIAEAIGLGAPRGALVRGVERGSPAETAGIEAGDVILSFGGRPIERWSDLPRTVGAVGPGTASSVVVWRKGAELSLNITVGEAQVEAQAQAPAPKVEPTKPVVNALGLAVIELSQQEREELRIRGGVRVVTAEGAAATAGIRSDDIILAINQNDVMSVIQFNEIVERLESGRTHGLLVRRGETSQWVAVQRTP